MGELPKFTPPDECSAELCKAMASQALAEATERVDEDNKAVIVDVPAFDEAAARPPVVIRR